MEKDHNELRAVLLGLGKILWPPIAVLVLHIIRQLVLPLAIGLDVLMHFLGGLSIAASAAMSYRLLRRRGHLDQLSYPFFGYLLITTALLVGVLWEFFEFFFAQNAMLKAGLNLYSDTLGDLNMDLLGALVWAAIEGFRKRE